MSRKIEFVPDGCVLVFVRQTASAAGNYQRFKRGEKQIKERAEYLCICGKLIERATGLVKDGRIKSCGCIKNANNFKHGLYYHPIYKIYRSIISRCYNKNHEAYGRYGGAGVTVCDEWRNDPSKFYDWCVANKWEPKLEIDKDVKGGRIYSPENCVLVTRKENSNRRSNNTILEYNGQKLTMSEWSDKTRIRQSVISMRIVRLKWSIEKTLTTPVRKNKK